MGGTSGGLTVPRPADRRPSVEALSVFLRSLALLVVAGIRLDRALTLLGQHSECRIISQVAHRLAHQVSQGNSLSCAFSKQGQAFSEIQVRMLSVGERTGTLHLVLANLADYEETRRATLLKVKAALTYPALLMIFSTLLLLILPPYMFGGLFAMLESASTSPPLLTQVVIGTSKALGSPWLWSALAGIGVLGYGVWLRHRENPQLRLRVAQAVLGLPVLGPLARNLATVRFARALEIQLKMGESPLLGLPLAAAASGNPVLQGLAKSAVESLKQGSSLTESLKATNFFPRTLTDMLTAGEESGRVPELLERTAALYESELDLAIERSTALLEPLIMLVMGVIVGLMVVATMLPMMTLIQSL